MARSPLETATAFLACIKSKDAASMQTMCEEGATACLIRDGKPRYMLVTDIVDRLLEGSDMEMDEVSYDEIEHVDGDFATVWTPFRFYIGGQLNHVGTNNFNLWKCPERGWTIVAVQDIHRSVEGIEDKNSTWWQKYIK